MDKILQRKDIGEERYNATRTKPIIRNDRKTGLKKILLKRQVDETPKTSEQVNSF